MPGVGLADRYAVGEIVGYGGMSTVYRGRDKLLDRDVAIKVLNQQIGDSERDRAAFLREARAAASLSHPGIVGTYDAGVFAGWPYIVMEYVPGGSLKEVIDTRAPLPPEQALPIAVAMADALAYGHDHGLVHCDVKPQNVLIDVTRHPKLVDFGISQSVAATTALTATVSGTAGYVAPEQLEGLPLDGRADVYSLGTVLYQMLSGALPFEAPNLTALATRRLVADARPLRDANPNVAPALAAIVDARPGAQSGGPVLNRRRARGSPSRIYARASSARHDRTDLPSGGGCDAGLAASRGFASAGRLRSGVAGIERPILAAVLAAGGAFGCIDCLIGRDIAKSRWLSNDCWCAADDQHSGRSGCPSASG